MCMFCAISYMESDYQIKKFQKSIADQKPGNYSSFLMHNDDY